MAPIPSREWLLRQLQCPFQGQTANMSPFYCAEMITRTGCPFGHRTQVQDPSDTPPSESTTAESPSPAAQPLAAIPIDVCVDFLLNRCSREQETGLLTKCSVGFHLNTEDLHQKCQLKTVYVPIKDQTPVGAIAQPLQGSAFKQKQRKKRAPRKPRKPRAPRGTPRTPDPFTAGTPITPTAATPPTTAATPPTTAAPSTILAETDPAPTDTKTRVELHDVVLQDEYVLSPENVEDADTEISGFIGNQAKCSKCCTTLPFLVLQEHCSCTYCPVCIYAFRSQTDFAFTVHCPTCSVYSRRLFLWPDAIDSDRYHRRMASEFEHAHKLVDFGHRFNWREMATTILVMAVVFILAAFFWEKFG